MAEKEVINETEENIEDSCPSITMFESVRLGNLLESGQIRRLTDVLVRLEIYPLMNFKASIQISKGLHVIGSITVGKDMELVRVGDLSLVLSYSGDSYFLKFQQKQDAPNFERALQEAMNKKLNSVFHERTDPTSSEQYFQFYGYLSQQQNMLQDFIRTSTYQRAMLENTIDFQDKVVLDVGAGSGILSFFAVQAGARKVYAVEASNMAEPCQVLIDSNMMSDQITVLAGKIEEIELEEQVDLIVSEPMGYMLFNERMLETFLHAKKWLKPGGKMYPSQGDLYIVPFTDDALYMEHYSKANFWQQFSFHGVNLTSLRDSAIAEYFRQPVVDTFDSRICVSAPFRHTVDFVTCDEKSLHEIDIKVEFTATQTANVHGLAFWFDVAFNGSQTVVWLSTSPTQPLTHWYQVRCLLLHPVFAKKGDILEGRVLLRCNTRQSYDVDIELGILGSEQEKSKNTLDLKNPCFRYTGQQVMPPPGSNKISPSDAYYKQLDSTVDGCLMEQQQSVSTTFPSPVVNGSVNSVSMVAHLVNSNHIVNNNNNFLSMAGLNSGSILSATIANNNNSLNQQQSALFNSLAQQNLLLNSLDPQNFILNSIGSQQQQQLLNSIGSQQHQLLLNSIGSQQLLLNSISPQQRLMLLSALDQQEQQNQREQQAILLNAIGQQQQQNLLKAVLNSQNNILTNGDVQLTSNNSSNKSQSASLLDTNFPLSNHLMIGDYVVPSNLVILSGALSSMGDNNSNNNNTDDNDISVNSMIH